jgi:Family of unknown function (DUF6134)
LARSVDSIIFLALLVFRDDWLHRLSARSMMMLRSQITAAARRARSFSFCLAGLVLVVGASRALSESNGVPDQNATRPTERQTRTYSISIDGTRRGECTTQFRASNGTVWTHSESQIRINYLVYRYNYSSTGTEIWKNGRLTALDNTADYNGKQYVVKGVAVPRGLQITTNGTSSLATPEIWDTSYSFLPERLARAESSVVLLDSDQGRQLSGKLQYLGEERVTVGEVRVRCAHYRIDGDVHVEIWFDASRRMVCEESKESGHRVRFELQTVTAE